MGFKLPFDRSMPGLIYDLDAFEKKVVKRHIAEHDALPEWLKDLGCTGTVDFPPKMTIDFPKYDVTLVGMPDEVFRKSNDRLCLVDYKTALCKGGNDPFLPVYQAQLLGYVHLLEANDVGKVDQCALVYFENKLKDEGIDPLDLITDDGFDVPFRVTIHEVEVNRSDLDGLLKKIRSYANENHPPKGSCKCKNCPLLQNLLDFEVNQRNQEDFARQRDGLARALSRELESYRVQARTLGLGSDEEPELAAEVQDCVPGPMDL
jgi:hypothetical protein